MNRLNGPSLLGFGDMFADGVSDGVSVGVRPGRLRRDVSAKGKSAKPSASTKGTMPVKKTKNKGKASPHKEAMANAATAGHRALAAAKGGFGKATIYKKNVKAGKYAPAVKLAALGFTGDARVVLGAASPAVRRALTPRQSAAITRHANIAAKLSMAKQAVAAAAKAATARGNAALAFVKTTLPIVKAALTVKPFTSGATSLGHVAALIEEAGGVDALTDEEVCGLAEVLADTGLRNDYMTPFEAIMLEPAHMGNVEIGVDANGLSPGQPGYDPTTDIDAMAAGATDPTTGQPAGTGTPGLASTDPGTGAVLAPDGSVLYDPTTDPAVVPTPVRGQSLTPDELSEVWQHVPDDGFVYGVSEGGKQYPQNSVGSANTFLAADKNVHGWGMGYIFGGSDWMYPSSDDRNTFEHGQFGSTAEIQGYSKTHGWGPLVGNPTGPLANLQYAEADKKWFWQGKAAPLSYSAEADSKIAQANAATIAANRAAAVVQAKQMQADQLAAQEAQSKADAANALAESTAASQQTIAQSQQGTQQGQLDIDTQKQQLAQAQMDAQYDQAQGQVQTQAQQAMIQQAQQEAKTQAQAQQLVLDEAATWNRYAAEHPEEAMAQLQAAASSQAGPADESDDDGGGEDDAVPPDEDGLDADMEDDLEGGTGDDSSDFPE